jgi:hypothetical protein
MIDFIKSMNVPVTVDYLLNHPFLEKFSVNAYDSGEENDNDQHCWYKDILFTINKVRKVRKLKGSLHKYWNNGLHNYNDFNFSEVVGTINTLQHDFNIDPFKCKLNNLEFGVNLITEFDPTDVIKDLIQQGRVAFTPISKGIGVTCRHSQYTIKVYSKSFQYSLPYHVLRIEIRVEVMDYFRINSIKVSTLADLMDIEIHKQLGENLLKRFNEILFYDSTIEADSLSKNDQLILSMSRIPSYWMEEDNKNKRTTIRRKYNEIFSAHVKRDWKKIITPLIRNKLDDLIYDNTCDRKPILPLLITPIIEEHNVSKEQTPNERIVKISSGDSSSSLTESSDSQKTDQIRENESDTSHLTDSVRSNKISSGDFSKNSYLPGLKKPPYENLSSEAQGNKETSQRYKLSPAWAKWFPQIVKKNEIEKTEDPLLNIDIQHSSPPTEQLLVNSNQSSTFWNTLPVKEYKLPYEQTPEIWCVLELEDFFKYAHIPNNITLDSYGLITDVRSFIQGHLTIIDNHYRDPSYQEYYDRLREIQAFLSRTQKMELAL